MIDLAEVEYALGHSEPGLVVVGGVADDFSSNHKSQDEESVS